MIAPKVQLAEVCDVKDGTHYTPPNTGGPFPFITVKDMTEDGLSFSDCSWITEEEFARAKKARACPEKGAVLFSKDGTVGKVHVVGADRPFAALSSIAILRPEVNRLDSKFLGFALQNPAILRDAENRKTGSALRRIILDDLKDVTIPLPPIPKQRQIAKLLEQAHRLRRMRRYALQMCDELLPATFVEMFGDPVTNPQGWPTDTLETASTKITDGEHLNPKFLSTGLPIVMAEQVEDSGVNLNSCKLVSASDFRKFITKCEPKQNDILLVSRGATIGRTCVVNTDKPFCLMGSVILIKPDSDVVNPYFLAAQLKSRSFLSVLRTTSGSSAQQAIYIAHVREKNVTIPPLSRQHEFASVVERHKRLRATHVETLRQADHLFQTLLHQAFANCTTDSVLPSVGIPR
jgi:type I restriction enzyme, S subunit